MKVIIAGSRKWKDISAIRGLIIEFEFDHPKISEIVSGGADGADLIGEMLAREKGIPIKRFLPDWGRYGRAAGPMRNEQMAQYAEALLLAWDGISAGSLSMLKSAQRHNLPVYGSIRSVPL
ncbi:MAG: DUF2493 domain-containing protein [Spirochaetes bacterium]|nr:MAG: DUF2493 domain-containing protein [Spirochaetota bacterium]